MKVLVTGGAGFIGSYTVDLLVKEGHNVHVLDNLDPQVHGKHRKIPHYISEHVRKKAMEFVFGDIHDRTVVKKCLKGIDAVVHLAAAVGVGQSMYAPHYYTSTNVDGTALLLETILQEEISLKKFIVASSMSIYGEGAYRCPSCKGKEPLPRSESQMKKKMWELACKRCGNHMEPIPTPEGKPLEPASMYALTKKMQEDMSILFGETYGIPTFALRYFNVYGPRQSLRNPYTGVIAIFLTRLLNKKPPLIFEDGLQSRDFISVKDVARANILALHSKNNSQHAVNIGTGQKTTVLDIAAALTKGIRMKIAPRVLCRYRAGDVRHCISDPTSARTLLDFQAHISLSDGIGEIIALSYTQKPADRVNQALRELGRKSLIQ